MRKGLTQYVLAKRVNKSHWWFSRMGRGLIKANEDEKMQIAKALASEVGEIFL